MGNLEFKSGVYVFHAVFSERELPKQAGFRWSAKHKIWYTQSPVVAAKLREYATENARTEINRFLIDQKPWTSPLPPPPEGLALLPHQPGAVHFALGQNRSYLGLDPGLGKTIVAARVVETLREKTVYICPPFLIETVAAEFARWAPSRSLTRYGDGMSFDADVLLLPDSMLIRDQALAVLYGFLKAPHTSQARPQPILIVDEAHRYKNEEAKRTRALLGHRTEPGIFDLFSRQLFMSGTPMPNRPMELYPILSKAAPETIDFMSRFDYGRRFCGGFQNHFGWDFSGASNLPELRRRVVAPEGKFMLRLKKSLLKLPPKLEELFVVSHSLPPMLARLDGEIGKRYDSTDDLIKNRIAARLAHSEKKSGVFPGELHIATYRRMLGQEKVKDAVTYIESLLDETDENILVFAYHKDVIQGLERGLDNYSPIVITGETPTEKRFALVKEFQTCPARRVVIGNYLAMGVGFTLTKATRVIFVEFSWVPGENEQASDRAHRIGQEDTVYVQYMVYKDSIDKAVIETLLRKRKNTQYV